jgi:hypothetical protein
MGFNSDQLIWADELEVCQGHAVAAIIIEAPRADGARGGDDAQEALSQRVAPSAHRTHVAGTGLEPAHGVGVHEAQQVTVRFLASYGPGAVGGDADGLPAAVAKPPAMPGAAAADADQCP